VAATVEPREPAVRSLKRLLGEPILHFFVIGAALFAIHGALAPDPRTIVIDRGVQADLARRFQDRTGRKPSEAELDRLLRDWKREEVLYREALVNGIDREDPTIRTTLADKMRARAALEIPARAPSEAELRDWLEKHRAMYEAPLVYDYEFVSFDRAEPNARRQFDDYERRVASGADVRTLGRPILGGNLSAEDMRERLGAEITEQITKLVPGDWRRIETGQALLLARVNRTSGGLPDKEELHRRLVADWTFATREEAIERAVQKLVKQYRFEERR
jgi:hypothetical protein